MPPITTWNIYNSDGSYLGQATAIAAQTAFCRFMLVSGRGIAESEVRSEAENDDIVKLIYGSEQFVLSPQMSRLKTA
jgi:hypothetical protein